jgi:hypothetical protein
MRTRARTRAEAIDFLASLIGLTADPSGPGYQFFRNLIAPGETDERMAEIIRESTCALGASGFLRWSIPEENCPQWIRPPYHDTQAPANVLRVAEMAGAVRLPGKYLPVPADIVHLAKGPGGPEHLYMIQATAQNPYGGLDVDSVDFGQKIGTFQACKARQRIIVPTQIGADDHEIPEGGTMAVNVRPIWKIYDWLAIVAFFTGE